MSYMSYNQEKWLNNAKSTLIMLLIVDLTLDSIYWSQHLLDTGHDNYSTICV